MSEEYGRCKCGGLGFRYSTGLPGNYTVCNKCHMIWEVDDGRLKQTNMIFTSEAMDLVLAGMQEIVYAYGRELKTTSVIDSMLEEVP